MKASEKLYFWRIKVAGYGDFLYFGTKADAEDMRVHKGEWEGGKATKRKAKDRPCLEEDEIQAIEEWAANHRSG